MTVALVDNDVLHKTTVYGLALPLLQSNPYSADSFHILVAAKFIISKKLNKHPPSRGAEQVLAEFGSVLAQVNQLEPTEQEIELAAQLEHLATQSGEELDGGESLLCAILITRQFDYIFTGDKRAVKGINTLVTDVGSGLARKVVCLEQLFSHLIQIQDAEHIRACVCAEPGADSAITNCFGCRSRQFNLESCKRGLNSYIGHLRVNAPDALS